MARKESNLFSRRPKILFAIAIIVVTYFAGYGMVRWRKVLVRYEYYSLGMKRGPLRYSIGGGDDLRESGVGWFKDTIAPPVAFVFMPLRLVETAVWNALR